MEARKPFLLSKEALFADLGYAPHPGQLEVHRSSAPRRVLACGVRWGKSTAAAMEAVAASLEPREESLGWIVAPNYDLAELVFRRTLSVLERHMPHRLLEASPREQQILLRNLGGGLSELRSKSAEHPASLLGEGLDWLIVDEAARMKEVVWESHLSQRLIDRRGWALLLSTPRGKDWFYRLFRRGQEKRGGGRDPDYESWNCPSWTNPLLGREAIERERGRLSADTFRQEYGAEFIGEGYERCEVCGDPDPDVSGAVVLQGGEKLGKCVECGAPVDKAGRAVRAIHGGGKPFLTVIELYPERPDVPLPGADASGRDPTWDYLMGCRSRFREIRAKGAGALGA